MAVTAYTDNAHGTMVHDADGGGRFTEVLRPHVTVASSDMVSTASGLHKPAANEKCFIANSVNFIVHHEPVTVAAASDPDRASHPTTR